MSASGHLFESLLTPWTSRARVALAIAIVSTAAGARSAPPVAVPPEGDARPEDPYTLTVRGGVSLGTYEAGLTWGAVRFLRAVRDGEVQPALGRPRLWTVTGASAGAVNAFLAAALWCERPDRRGTVDANLLLDAWRDLDVSELLPSSSQAYSPGDGLLAAAPLERTGRALGEALFGPGAAGRYRPDCRVTVGITVTPYEPRSRDVAGLSASTQRLVLPWRLEAGADGRLVVRRQPLPDADARDDVLDLAGVPGPGDATPFRPGAVIDALLASTAVPIAFAPRRLCARAASPGSAGEDCALYVDGGIFDNAPLGLDADLSEGTGAGGVLRPITTYLVDPDRLRVRLPRVESPGGNASTPLERQLRLLENLLGTARSAELAHAARSRGWNRTTERLVGEASVEAQEVAELYAAVLGGASGDAGAPDGGAPRARADGAAFGRALSACLERAASGPGRSQAACVRDVLTVGVPSDARSAAPLSPQEVVRLADDLVAFLRGPLGRAREHRPPSLDDAHARGRAAALPARPAPARLSPQVNAAVAAAGFHLLADEVRRVSAGGLPEEELRRFREAVLEVVRGSDAVPGALHRILRERVDQELLQLARVAPPSVADAAVQARTALLASAPEAPIPGELLEPAISATHEALARGAWSASGASEAWRGLLRLMEARTAALGLSSRLATLRRDAAALTGGGRSEHRLVLSSRFAPLAGSQLAGFGGFLDAPLRRYDFYAGVYEAVHLTALAICANRAGDGGGPAPVRSRQAPSELDLAAVETQRCVGAAMQQVAGVLGVPASPHASRVVSTLAGLELAAALGSSSRARSLLSEPSWSWIGELGAPPAGDPVAVALDALTSRKVRCRPEDAEALCPAELSFNDFLAALAAAGYQPASEGMASAMSAPAAWWAVGFARATHRALSLESASTGAPGPLSAAAVTAFGAASLVSRRAAARGRTPRFVLDPSTIPGAAAGSRQGQRAWVLAHALPYRLSLDFAHGGFGAAWLEPELHLTRWMSVQSTLEELGYRSGTGFTSSAGVLLVARGGGLSLGAGPRGWLDWRGGSHLGAEARVAALQDRLAFGIGLRNARPGARRREWFLTVSVADLNGMLFWLVTPGRSR